MPYKRKPYHTGLVDQAEYLAMYPPPPYKGKTWHIVFGNCNENKYQRNKQEVTIYASNQQSAQKALNMITSSLELYSGQPISPFGDIDLFAYNDEELKELDKDELAELRFESLTSNGIPAACLIASKASYRKKYIYAIAKYHFSVSLYNQFEVDLEPWAAPHLPVSIHPEDHVAFSHAIISAYSVLEELGLEMRASSKKPSMINGKWNPEVREDLEHRLKEAGVDLGEKLLWTLRGPRRKLERVKQIPIFEKMRWAVGPVRDSTVEIVDAIAYTSWLRSFVASHKVKEITEVISPYDVINTQHLARRLLLEPFGIWKDFFIQMGRSSKIKKDRSGRGKILI